MYKFVGIALKDQHPLKMSTPNADMTANGPHFAVVLDGVSGVPPPMRAEDLPMDLRNCLRTNLRARFHPYQDRQRYDQDMLVAIGGQTIPNEPAGGWLTRLVHFSLQQTNELGSTCLAIATLLGSRMTWLLVGDCAIRVYRHSPAMGTFNCIFAPPPQTVMMQTPDGRQVFGPRQISVYSTQDRSSNAVSRSVGQANYNTFDKILANDIVVLCSDGAIDNVADNTIVEIIRDACMSRPGYIGDENLAFEVAEAIARQIIATAVVPTAPEPDDVSVFVGVIKPMR